MYYNTDQLLWENYKRDILAHSPFKSASVVILPSGDIANGIAIIARFPSRRKARKTLEAAGWRITPQLGMGCCTRALNARVTA